MADPFHHAQSSVRRWGGTPEDYVKYHAWFDETKKSWADPRHRLFRHHAEGIAWMIDYFMALDHRSTPVMINTDGRMVPLRYIGEQHVVEDLGFIPSMKDWIEQPDRLEKIELPMKSWMALGAQKISKEINKDFQPRTIPSEVTNG
jgi:uncharacterized protein DUF6915